MRKSHISLGDMIATRTAETRRSVEGMTTAERAELYQRWITYFAYEDDSDPFDAGWSAEQLVKQLFQADTLTDLFQFLLNERLITKDDK